MKKLLMEIDINLTYWFMIVVLLIVNRPVGLEFWRTRKETKPKIMADARIQYQKSKEVKTKEAKEAWAELLTMKP